MIDRAAFGEILPDGTLRFERLLPGPIERVWDYLTKSDLLATWIGPIAVPSMPGAEFTHQWDGGGTVKGRTRIYEPPTILEYDWHEGNAPGGAIHDTIVRFELTAQGENVMLVLTHHMLPHSTFVMVAAGWHSHVDALQAELAREARVDRDARYDELEPTYEATIGGGPSTSSG